MLFNSYGFLFLFLPIVLCGFLLLQRWGKVRLLLAWLIAASLFFYAWWNPIYLALLLLSGAVNYSIGLLLARKPDGRFPWLFVGIAFNLGLLGYFKYANFFVANIAVFLEPGFNFEHVVLPLAISFYTFQQITYLVDVRKGLTESHDWLEYALFVCFFPQLIAGPIVHHSEMLAQFKNIGKKIDIVRQFSLGGSIFAIGLFKKVIIADTFAKFATPVFDKAAAGQTMDGLSAIAGSLSYTFQLYFDFSGYSDMAIGLACLFGIKLPVNFLSPYRAQNIRDFWRMWHATLGRFLADYVYKPLGGSFCSPNRHRFNLFATMFVSGVWHGAGWTFVVYGIFHGIYVVVQQIWRGNVSEPLGLIGNRAYQAAAQLLTFIAVVIGWIVFRADTLTAAGNVYRSIPNLTEPFAGKGLSSLVSEFGLVYGMIALALIFCWLLPSTHQLFKPYDVAIDQPKTGRAPALNLHWQPNKVWAVSLAILLGIALLSLQQPSEFLYFQF